MVTFGEQNWRWRGGVARPDVNLDFYGTGRQRQPAASASSATTSTAGSRRSRSCAASARARTSSARAGSTSTSTASFDPVAARARARPPASRAMRSSGLGLTFEHDSRDNFFTPSRGWKGYARGDVLLARLRQRRRSTRPTARTPSATARSAASSCSAARLDARAARGDVPFYQLPFIELRGIPAARYQDENVGRRRGRAALERRRRAGRWSASPAPAAPGARDQSFSDADTVELVGRRLPLPGRAPPRHLHGLDIARGPEDTAFYIQVGSAWR